jgi:DNA polymerase elongation subunit (family B)
LGGIHGCIESGLYVSDNEFIIIDADVASLYPNLAIANDFYIQHLGKEFLDVYLEIIKLRIDAKNKGNTTLADAFKLSANSVYGKSNDMNSFLYDPKFTMSITLNGQLLLTKLAESLVNIPNSTILQINTDGVTMKIPRSEKHTYDNLCKAWEKETNLTLEYVEYSKMWIRDVNNYGALSTKGKIKNKGCFEVDKNGWK